MHRFAVLEGNALQQQLDLFGAVDTAPGFLGFLNQLECKTEEGRSRHAVARARRTVAYRRERRFNRVGGTQVLPVLRGEVVEMIYKTFLRSCAGRFYVALRCRGELASASQGC